MYQKPHRGVMFSGVFISRPSAITGICSHFTPNWVPNILCVLL